MPGKGKHLLLAAAHLVGSPLLHAGKVGEDVVEPLARPRAVRMARPGADLQILVDGQIGEDAPVFRHEADASTADLEGPEASDIGAVELDPSAPALHQAHDGAERGRLASTVAAEENGDLAARDGKGHIGQNAGLAVMGDEIVDKQEAH